MREKKWLDFFRFIAVLVILIGMNSKKVEGVEITGKVSQSTSPDEVKRFFHQIGAKQTDQSGLEFELETGIHLALVYSDCVLAAVKVSSTNTFQDSELETKPQRTNENQQTREMSKSTYIKILRIVDQLKPLGKFVQEAPIAVIPTSGWVNRVEEYSLANIVRVERNCLTPNLECGVKRFTVFYWFLLKGTITSTRIEKIEFLGEPICKYLVTVDEVEIEVSMADYFSLKKGQVVYVKRTLDNNFAKIESTSINDQ